MGDGAGNASASSASKAGADMAAKFKKDAFKMGNKFKKTDMGKFGGKLAQSLGTKAVVGAPDPSMQAEPIQADLQVESEGSPDVSDYLGTTEAPRTTTEPPR